MRPTTEQGARWERCNFSFGFINDVSPTGSPQSNAIQLISGQSMIAGMTGAGTEAVAVARMLQLPLRDFEVKALVMDVHAYPLPYLQDAGADFTPDAGNETVQCGLAVYTQQLDANGAPSTLPPYWLSQWPVNVNAPPTQFEEDRDYATRTHLSRTFVLRPHYAWSAISDPFNYVLVPGRIDHSSYIKLRINRKFGDKYGLFFGTWTSNPGVSGMDTNAIQFLVNGSIWYKMKF